MKNWQEDLLVEQVRMNSEHALFQKTVAYAKTLGFDYCAYGLQIPTSLTNPKIIWLNNYSPEWQARYVHEGYLSIDPIVQHGRRSRMPIIWNDEFITSSTRAMSEEAKAAGLRIRWAQSCVNATGIGGLLTLSRSSEELSPAELASQEIKMQWLASVTHFSLSRLFVSQVIDKVAPKLTAREIEVLKWTADGKISSDISLILNISENTVNFHIKNAIAKLKVPNKTAAVVRGCMLGLLN